MQNIMSQNSKKRHSFEYIQLPLENFNSNNTKFCNNLLTEICEKMTFAQLKANDIATSGKSSMCLSSLSLKTEGHSRKRRELFD